ncbi:MAG: hypothetical protein JNM45_11680 [Rhizobiales bacterium]|nr:hypothetical protein [Hyphomicrobiales bacterium]
MKSWSAWSVDREDAARLQKSNSVEQLDAAGEFEAEIGAISDTLMKTLTLYELAALQKLQRATLRQWVKRQGELVETSISEQAARLRSNLVNAVAGAVEPLLKEVIEKKAIDDFCDVMEKAASRSIFENSIISVPARLHAALQEELQKRGLKLEAKESGEEEISVAMGDTHIETRIGSVVEELNGVLQQ